MKNMEKFYHNAVQTESASKREQHNLKLLTKVALREFHDSKEEVEKLDNRILDLESHRSLSEQALEVP
jgi:hypothetical protein